MKAFRQSVLSMFSALFFVLLARSTLAEPFQIPSGSMIPTLLVGDHVMVNKLSYGLRIPFSDWISLSTESHYLFRTGAPERGEVIVFRHPNTPDVHLIKRVIGIPGDTIEMRDKIIYVNGKAPNRTPLTTEQIEAIFASLSPEEHKDYPISAHEVFQENFDRKMAINMIDQRRHHSENFDPITVPAAHYFCMGDNRDNSSDSRSWGFVPFGNIKGRALVIWFSAWMDMANSDFRFHPERIGKIL